MNKNPLVSIVTVSYNAISTIEETILSVINQTYSNIEYIIIDGGSTDGTVDIIKKYAKKISYWISEPDKGIYDAMNKGVAKASGDLIGIINSDDIYSKNIIDKIVSTYILDPYSIIHGNIIFISHKKEIKKKPNLNINHFYKGTLFFHPTMFVPSIHYRELGGFNTKYKIAADYDFMLRLITNNKKFIYIDEYIAHMRSGGESDVNAINGYKEVRNIAITYNYSKNKVYWAYIKKIIHLWIKKIWIS